MALQTNQINDGETAEFEVDLRNAVFFRQAGNLTFWAKCDSEVDFDMMEILLDGASVEPEAITVNENEWREYYVVFNNTENSHITFRYEKDGSVMEGEDACWVDTFTFKYCCEEDEGCGGSIISDVEEYVDAADCNCYNIAYQNTYFSITETTDDDWCRTNCFNEAGEI